MFNSSTLGAVELNGVSTLACSVASTSHVGDRAENQDSLKILHLRDRHLFAIIADGLGGHSGGAVASNLAIQAISCHLQQHASDEFNYVALFGLANSSIIEARRQSARLSQMRTTLVMLHLDLLSATAYWLHCGDSRLLHVSGREIVHRTLDHSVAQMMVADGELSREEIRLHPERNRLLRSLGGSIEESHPRAAASAIGLSDGWGFMLSTDGWWELLSESEIAEHHNGDALDWISELDALVQARQRTGSDNASAIAISSRG